MSAMNLQTSVDGINGLKGYKELSDLAAQKSRIRVYCNAHPLALYMDAVMDTLGSLPTKAMPPTGKRFP
jgi:hypothetical protein